MSADSLTSILRLGPVVPVLTIDRVEDAVPLGRALVLGGLPVLEVTLRTPAALGAIRALAVEVPDAVGGAGTLLSPEDVAQARAAGARFGVSPGSTPELVASCARLELPFLPGVATPSEAMALRAAGLRVLKLFPAFVVGGIAALKAFGAPLSDLRFCPTGGIGEGDFLDYLALGNVLAVGGSWVAPGTVVRDGDWSGIEALARTARAKAEAAGWRAER